MPSKNQTTSSTPAPKKARRGRKKPAANSSEVVATPAVEATPTAVNEAVAPEAAVDEVTETPELVAEEPDIIALQFNGIITTLGTFRQSITALQAQIRGLEKSVRREMKVLRKEAMKNKAKGNRKPSGFAKPSLVTPELCKFMGKDEGTQIARTEVTQYLIQYIKDNELQYADNKKIILPDETLKALLNPPDNEEVTYFNLQRLMNKHFVKGDAVSGET